MVATTAVSSATSATTTSLAPVIAAAAQDMCLGCCTSVPMLCSGDIEIAKILAFVAGTYLLLTMKIPPKFGQVRSKYLKKLAVAHHKLRFLRFLNS